MLRIKVTSICHAREWVNLTQVGWAVTKPEKRLPAPFVDAPWASSANDNSFIVTVKGGKTSQLS